MSDDDQVPAPRGADLAREALAQARAKNAQKRRTSVVGRSAGQRNRRRWSGSGPDSRDPQLFGAALAGWVKGNAPAGDLTKATLFGRWEQIVGPDIARHATPVSLVDGELLVQAESTAWATQIRLLTPSMMTKISAGVGPGVVKRIKAQGPTGPSWRFGPRHVSGRGPRDTYG